MMSSSAERGMGKAGVCLGGGGGGGGLGYALEAPADPPPPLPKLLPLGGSVLAHVHRVVHDAAEGVDGKDRLALGARQEEEGVEEVGAALAGQTGDEALGVHAAPRRAEGRPTKPPHKNHSTPSPT